MCLKDQLRGLGRKRLSPEQSWTGNIRHVENSVQRRSCWKRGTGSETKKRQKVFFPFLKMGQSRPLFLFIFVFSTCYNLNSNLNWKKHRWCAWDLNPGRQDGRRKWIHWAMAAPLYLFIFVFLNKHHYNYYNKYMWKMSIQYTVPEFKPTTFGTRVSSHNH